MKKLYCFDFDGTLTFKDTMFGFLKFYNKKRFYFNFFRHVPLFVLLKAGLLPAENVKKSFIASCLKGASEESIARKAQLYCDRNFEKLIRPNALEFIQQMDPQARGVIVSASLDIWVAPFAKRLHVGFLATQAEYINGCFTGHFIGENCNGDEKVNRLITYINRKEFDKVIAFGDTAGDKAMMEWADEAHFKFFH